MTTESQTDQRIVSVILAGGRGQRMRCDHKHKVCFEVGGVPVILRALHNYQQAGLTHHVIVVGALGEQVLHAVGQRVPNVSFVLQPEPRGTGHAARCGAAPLEALGYQGLVLVAVGDRLISPHVVRRLINTLREEDCDVVFLVGPKSANPSSGRVLFDSDGSAAAIVETSEIALSSLVLRLEALLAESGAGLRGAAVVEEIRRRWPNDQKAHKICGELYSAALREELLPAAQVEALLAPLRAKTLIEVYVDGTSRQVPAAEVEAQATEVNLSAYLFRAPVLYDALRTIAASNAQGEEYITDCIKNLGLRRRADGTAQHRVRTVCVEHEDDSLSFNTPEELAEIERKWRQDQPAEAEASPAAATALTAALRPAAEWLAAFSANTAEVQAFLAATYGPQPEVHEEKRAEFVRVLQEYLKLYPPDREVLMVRSPGRVNLMGRHIDHRGGNTNVIAINDEILIVAAPRTDDTITLHNTDGTAFDEASFSISEEIAHLDWSDWQTCVNSPRTLALAGTGDWSNYVRAAALRLQEHFRRRPLLGADLVIHGTIPVGSGLSSSSAMVVGAAEVLVSVNQLPLRPSILVDLCGEGEWFVGTRGGANDHAAIKFGRRGSVAHVGFFPFEVLDFVPFFEDYVVVVCNSGVQARKSQKARIGFNKRILGYTAGELILCQQHPDLAPSIHHLRDVSCENLGISLAELYRLLKELPLSITRRELMANYGPFAPAAARKLEGLLLTLPPDDTGFDVRGVVLFGLAEMERARRCVEYLRAGDAEGFGVLANLSHDGDRVISHDDDLRPVPWTYEVSDEYLDGLIADLESGEATRVARAQLYRQPGKYACSTERIDLIVDLARRQPGVVGAQIAGAGLGGCVIIVVHQEAAEALIATYAEAGFQARRYHPVEGAGLVSLG